MADILRADVRQHEPALPLIAASAQMQQIQDELKQAARSDAKILADRREWCRKGSDRAAGPPIQPASRAPVCRDQLRGSSRYAARIGVVRARPRELHGSVSRQAGTARASARRHDLPGRDRRDEPPHAGPAAAFSRGRRHPARRRRTSQRHDQRAHRHCDQPRADGPHRRGRVPRGPVLSHQRHSCGDSAAARAPRRHRAAASSFHARVRREIRRRRPRGRSQCHGEDDRL